MSGIHRINRSGKNLYVIASHYYRNGDLRNIRYMKLYHDCPIEQQQLSVYIVHVIREDRSEAYTCLVNADVWNATHSLSEKMYELRKRAVSKANKPIQQHGVSEQSDPVKELIKPESDCWMSEAEQIKTITITFLACMYSFNLFNVDVTSASLLNFVFEYVRSECK